MERLAVLGADRNPVEVRSAEDQVLLRSGQFIAGQTNAPVRESITATGIQFDLPYSIVGLNAGGQKVELNVVAEISGGGLRLDPSTGAFIGRLFVGLQDTLSPQQAANLGRSIGLLVTAAAESVTPESFTLNHTNLPFSSVQILARSPGDTVAVRIRPEFDSEGIELSIPVNRPPLAIEIAPPRIQGFGLETADITVSARGSAVTGPIVIRLSSDGARPDPPVVTLDAMGTATASLRSRGLGTAEVTASSEFMVPATATIEFVSPWGFAIAAILGGIVGGAIRALIPLLGSSKRLRPRELTLQAALGILAGVLTASAYAVGLNFLDINPTAVVGEALVFTIGALGALSSGALFTQSPSNAPKD